MNPPPPLPPKPPRKSIALPLVLAFVPAALILLFVMVNPPSGHLAAFAVPATLISLASCVTSSVMLFKRRTTAALIFGILLVLLNAAISLGLGCIALLGDMNSPHH